MPEPIARSAITPAQPTCVRYGWEVSARSATGGLTLTDCTPLVKFGVRAQVAGQAAAELGVPFGRSARGGRGSR